MIAELSTQEAHELARDRAWAMDLAHELPDDRAWALRGARYDWRIPDLAEALFDEDQYRDPDWEHRQEGQRLALEFNAVAREVLREYASMERRKQQGKPYRRPAPRPTGQPATSWAERDREAAARMGWTTRSRFPCPFTKHDNDDRAPGATLLPGDNDRLRIYCHKCGEHASAADAAEGIAT